MKKSDLKKLVGECMAELQQSPSAINLDTNKIEDIEVDGIDRRDYPDFVDAFVTKAVYPATENPTTGNPEDWRELTDVELEWLNDTHPEVAQEAAREQLFESKKGKNMKSNELRMMVRECITEAKKAKKSKFKPFEKKKDKKEMVKEALKKMIQETIEEFRTKGALGIKNRPEFQMMGQENMEKKVREFLSTRLDTNIHIDQLQDLASLIGLGTIKSDIDLLFQAISAKIDEDPNVVKPMFDFLAKQHLVKI